MSDLKLFTDHVDVRFDDLKDTFTAFTQENAAAHEKFSDRVGELEQVNAKENGFRKGRAKAEENHHRRKDDVNKLKIVRNGAILAAVATGGYIIKTLDVFSKLFGG